MRVLPDSMLAYRIANKLVARAQGEYKQVSIYHIAHLHFLGFICKSCHFVLHTFAQPHLHTLNLNFVVLRMLS